MKKKKRKKGAFCLGNTDRRENQQYFVSVVPE